MTKPLPTSVRPVGHHLVIEPVALPRESEGGIIINLEGTEFEKVEAAGRMIGTVLAVGPQCWKAHEAGIDHILEARDPAREPWVSVGDIIIYSRYAGKFVRDPMFEDKREVYVINDDDVVAVLPPQSEWAISLHEIVG
jgi:co-chaperonin GroES (HSP10)